MALTHATGLNDHGSRFRWTSPHHWQPLGAFIATGIACTVVIVTGLRSEAVQHIIRTVDDSLTRTLHHAQVTGGEHLLPLTPAATTSGITRQTTAAAAPAAAASAAPVRAQAEVARTDTRPSRGSHHTDQQTVAGHGTEQGVGRAHAQGAGQGVGHSAGTHPDKHTGQDAQPGNGQQQPAGHGNHSGTPSPKSGPVASAAHAARSAVASALPRAAHPTHAANPGRPANSHPGPSQKNPPAGHAATTAPNGKAHGHTQSRGHGNGVGHPSGASHSHGH